MIFNCIIKKISIQKLKKIIFGKKKFYIVESNFWCSKKKTKPSNGFFSILSKIFCHRGHSKKYRVYTPTSQQIEYIFIYYLIRRVACCLGQQQAMYHESSCTLCILKNSKQIVTISMELETYNILYHIYIHD